MIELFEDYVVDADKDARNYILCKMGKDGKPKNYWYFTTLQAAVKGAVERVLKEKVHNNVVTSLDTWLEQYAAYTNQLEKIFKKD